jgi:trimeric autotransporter adhesin
MFETISSNVPRLAGRASKALSRPAFATATLALSLATAILLAALTSAGPARAATTFTVSNTGDQGDANFSDGRCDTEPFTSGNQCTLRAAIEQANETPGADSIHFDVGGSGVNTISPASELPQITEAVTIDGYTQPGAKNNTKTSGTDAVLKVELNGTNVDRRGLEIGASNVVVKGLAINRFGGPGIFVSGAGARIEGNFIGTDSSGSQALGNDSGVVINGLNATVGGATPAARNLLSGNFFDGVSLFGSGAKVSGNLIGTGKDGATALSNGLDGVGIFGSNNFIGGTAPGEANTIAFNSSADNFCRGVAVFDDTGNRVLSNSIFSNEGLGIDLVGGTEIAAGATKNDPKDPDTGPNNLQNKPKVSSATTASGKITIEGNLNSTPEKTFVLQIFSNPPGGEEGKTFIGQRSVTTKANGNAPFTLSFAETVRAGRTVTATATGPGGNTSEFSAPRTVVAQ